MQLTRFADLGLRVLMYLVQVPAGQRVTTPEIARIFDVPLNHLTKVVNTLVQAQLVHAVRGRVGGISLARPAMSIRIGDALLALEGNAPLVNCSKPPCLLAGTCGLMGVLESARLAFYTGLNEYTLADVSVHRTGTLLRSLQIHPV